MTAYLTLAEFQALTIMPADQVANLETVAPGWIDNQLEHRSRWLDARLRKRYAVPFDTTSTPETIKAWLARIVTHACYLKRGVEATDEQYLSIKEDAQEAEAEIKEAADSEVGLFDLPLLSTTSSTGVSAGGPFVYSEQSPYVYYDQQSATARTEDQNGGGTYG